MVNTLNCLFQIVRETFRQALASRVFGAMFIGMAVCILLCASARIEGGAAEAPAGSLELYGGDGKPLAGPNPAPGHLTLGFGAIRLPLFRDGASEVHFLLAAMAKWVAGTAGILLALVATSGFLPDFLAPSAISIALARPVARTTLLVGKAAGALVFVGLVMSGFIGGTWLALGLATGYWNQAYLWCIPLLLLQFATVYGVSACAAVWTRNASVCVFASIGFWIVCFLVDFGRHSVAALADDAPTAAVIPIGFVSLLETLYWVLPKPADLVMIQDALIGAAKHFSEQPALERASLSGAFSPADSIATSLAFSAALMGIAAYSFHRQDY